MQIRRIRRLSVKDEWPMCDFCDEPFIAGFEFGGENVGGPRGKLEPKRPQGRLRRMNSPH